jgi:undecaprenyl-diphosphatase
VDSKETMPDPSSSTSNNEQHEETEGWKVAFRSYQFAGCAAIFIGITLLVTFHFTDSFDMAVVKFFHDIEGAQFDGVMIAFTLVGDLTTVLGVAIILTILRRTRKLGLAILVSLVATSILLMYIKPVIARPLPPFGFHAHIPLPDKFTFEQDVVGFTHIPYSFPSSHETFAVSLAFLLGFFLSRRCNGQSRVRMAIVHVVWLYPILVGISRLYVSAHYPFDLFASAALGIILSYVIIKVLKLDILGEMSDTLFSKARQSK